MTSHIALDSNAHRDLRIRAGASAELGDQVMACLTVPSEFRRVQNEFPILFRRDLDSGRFSALALFGFENGENLFLEEGRWDARYRPLALTIQPFLVGRAKGEGSSEVHIDLDHSRVAEAGKEGLRSIRRSRPANAISREHHGRPRRARSGASLERRFLRRARALRIARPAQFTCYVDLMNHSGQLGRSSGSRKRSRLPSALYPTPTSTAHCPLPRACRFESFQRHLRGRPARGRERMPHDRARRRRA